MTEIILADQQKEAASHILNWFNNEPNKQIFSLAGFAGTGKTTLVNYVVQDLDIPRFRIEFACYTGKAALVLTRKSEGAYKARTIHQLIYELVTDKDGKKKFEKKQKHALDHLKLIVIDEWSMVDDDTFQDLKSFGVKLLLIGDQGQLPPVSRSTSQELEDLRENPDFCLTEIHRQAADNPIIYLSMLARTGRPIPYGWYGKNKEVLVMDKIQFESVRHSVYKTADQIICGKNKTKDYLNKDIRQFLGFTDPLPQKGDKLICTKNNWEQGISDINLVNGLTGFVEDVNYKISKTFHLKHDAMRLNFRPDFTEEQFKRLYVLKDKFNGKEDPRLFGMEHSLYSQFDFGYAITCHKSQGSQWDKVVVISEKLGSGDQHHRWLYTAITRSADRLVLVI